MTGKTHLAVGTASALALLQPSSIPELIIGTGTALIGSVICDIDVGTSESHEKANKVIAFTLLIICAITAAECYWKLGIWNLILSSGSLQKILLSTAALLVLCIFGKAQPHRSFMHSIPALLLFTFCVREIVPAAAPYFAVSFFSHMTIDFLNKKGLQLFYPLKFRISLRLCSSSGITDHVMRWTGTIAAVSLFGLFAYLNYHPM